MTDQYYEWTPTQPDRRLFADVKDDYVENANEIYTPTQWDGVDIEQMRMLVRDESDERTLALAEAWHRTSALLQATRASLKRHADGLAAKWHSPAGQYFMGKVGAALYSLDEWTEVADRHARGLEQVGNTITQTQREMGELWRAYVAEQDRQYHIRKADEGIQLSDFAGMNNGKTYEQVKKEFHERAKSIVTPLAELYVDVAHTHVQRGGKYKGPTNVPEIGLGQLPPPVLPNAPVGLGPSTSTMSGDRPELLTRPNVTPPPPSEPTDGIGLAGGTVTAPPPTLGPPAATPPIPTPPTPTPGPPPVFPGVNGPTPTGPNTPTTTNRPGFPRPTLLGTSTPGTTGTPGARGPVPNPHQPALGRPTTPPPPTLLNGAHGTPAPTTNRPTPLTGGSHLTGQTAAGNTRPTGSTRAVGSTGPAPLGGHARTRHATDQAESWEYGEGDDELWTTTPPPTGTITTPTEQRPRHHGKAIGQS